MASSAADQIEVVRLKNQRAMDKLKTKLNTAKDSIKAMRKERNLAETELSLVEGGKVGGILQATVGLVAGVGGMLVAYSLQRWVEGMDFGYKSIVAGTIPISAFSVVVALPILMVPNRYAKGAAGSWAIGAVGGSYMGRAKGKF